MNITTKHDLKSGDRVKVLFTDWVKNCGRHVTQDQLDRGEFPTFDNGQLGKPTKVEREVSATVVPCSWSPRKLSIVLDGGDRKDTSDPLKDFKKGQKVSATWGGTPYKGTWYYTSAIILAKEVA